MRPVIDEAKERKDLEKAFSEVLAIAEEEAQRRQDKSLMGYLDLVYDYLINERLIS